MIEIVVSPKAMKASRRSSRASMLGRYARMTKQPSPVIRWTSTMRGVAFAKTSYGAH